MKQVIALLSSAFILTQLAAAAQELVRTIQSPRKTFRLEEYHSQEHGSQIWVVSNTERRLLHPQDDREVRYPILQPQNNRDPLDGCEISPNEQWIFCHHKQVVHNFVGQLYKRRAGIDFRPAMGQWFDEAAWQFFEKKTGIKPDVEIQNIFFKSWSPDSRRLEFELCCVKGRSGVWSGYYDTITGKFGIAQ